MAHPCLCEWLQILWPHRLLFIVLYPSSMILTFEGLLEKMTYGTLTEMERDTVESYFMTIAYV